MQIQEVKWSIACIKGIAGIDGLANLNLGSACINPIETCIWCIKGISGLCGLGGLSDLGGLASLN